MPTPVIEQLTQNIVDTLSNVTVANGCNYTIIVEREKRRGNKPRDLLVVVYQKDPQQDDSNPLQLSQWIQPYALEIFIEISSDELDTMPPSKKLNLITADIMKALMVDRHRNNIGIDTLVTPWEDFQAITGEYEGRQFNFQVTYRTSETDPYVLG